MRAIKIIEPGPLATVQDRGRFGFRDKGVPVCGAVDQQAYRLGNLLAGNLFDAASIEITLGGFVAQFLGEAYFALTGAQTEARLNGRPLSTWKRHFGRIGEVIETGPPVSGLRTYLAVDGGIDVSPVMGSRSTFLRGGLGGLEGRALRKKDLLFFGDAPREDVTGKIFEIPAELVPAYGASAVLRVIPGPQIGRISPRGIDTFFSSEFVVSNRTDRMGSILCGPAIALACGADIISGSAFPGAVQIPGNGQPVVLGNDCQTTGGYVLAASVIDVDLSFAAQLFPGATVRFAEASLDEARLAFLKNEYRLKTLREKLKAGGRKCEWT
ncbi:MAG: biotin-dependent carboxyltransferase family protein [Syntrophobacteraceae bacterium]|nr:biotin-dependent carboxyltransferase family protein [Syntrophobacteraceae bacterium]